MREKIEKLKISSLKCLHIKMKMSGIKENFHYKFFSKKGKNFFKTAKDFTEKTLNIKIDSQSKIYCDKDYIEQIKILTNEEINQIKSYGDED